MNQVAEAEAREPVSLVRQLADQAFSRAAGALLIPGNSVHLYERCIAELPGVVAGDCFCPANYPLRELHYPRGRHGTYVRRRTDC